METESKIRVLLSDGTEPTFFKGAEIQQEAMPSMKLTGEFRVSSVGREKRVGEDCRWIELSWQQGNKTASQATNILKLLVLEKQLTRGRDPLDHPMLALFNEKQADRTAARGEPGFDRIQYEIDRFRSVFPPPLTNQKQAGKRSIQTRAGDFPDCEIITGTTEWHWPLMNGGRWQSRWTWEIALHSSAPFGVVAMKGEGTTREFSRTAITETTVRTSQILESVGDQAASELPSK